MTAAILGTGLVLPEAKPVILPGPAGTHGAPGYACDFERINASIPAKFQRRSGRSQRMALKAAAEAIKAARVGPGGIRDTSVYAGTGLGQTGRTVGFLENMFEFDEAQPKPADFINSVHNSVAGILSLAFDLRGENRTFVHESISFEHALRHASLAIETKRSPSALVCGVDEQSPYVVSVGARYGWWKDTPQPLAPLDANSGPKTLPGEGATALFLASPREGEKAPILRGVRAERLERVGYPRINGPQQASFIEEALREWGVPLEEIDIVVAGANGDETADAAYRGVLDAVSKKTGQGRRIETYKERCGEFCTASGVGLVVAAGFISGGEARNALVLGFPQGRYRSVILVSA